MPVEMGNSKPEPIPYRNIFEIMPFSRYSLEEYYGFQEDPDPYPRTSTPLPDDSRITDEEPPVDECAEVSYKEFKHGISLPPTSRSFRGLSRVLPGLTSCHLVADGPVEDSQDESCCCSCCSTLYCTACSSSFTSESTDQSGDVDVFRKSSGHVTTSWSGSGETSGEESEELPSHRRTI